jgi:hypothetical protein
MFLQEREGGTAVYAWATERVDDEDWVAYVTRCAHGSNRAIESWPRVLELPEGFQGLILCNLEWAPKA